MEKTNTEYINPIAYDMIYLVSFGINSKCKPDEKCLERYRTNEENRKELFRMSAKYFIDALVGTTLKQAGVVLPKYWEERMVKTVRKVLLFDAERKKLCAWMESEHIWYLPLKGIVLKDYYPSVGMRQMSDNDILFDEDAWSQTAWRNRKKQMERRICQSLVTIGTEYFREWSCMRIIRCW